MPDTSSVTSSGGGDASGLDAAFLALLCCPVCPERPGLELRLAASGQSAGSVLHCTRCRRDYPIVDGIPDLRPTDTERVAGAAETV